MIPNRLIQRPSVIFLVSNTAAKASIMHFTESSALQMAAQCPVVCFHDTFLRGSHVCGLPQWFVSQSSEREKINLQSSNTRPDFLTRLGLLARWLPVFSRFNLLYCMLTGTFIHMPLVCANVYPSKVGFAVHV